MISPKKLMHMVCTLSVILNIEANASKQVLSDDFYKLSISCCFEQPKIVQPKFVHGIHALNALGFDGSGATVALIDTSVEHHQNLKGRVCYFSQSAYTYSFNPKHSNHGTHVAGIIAAKNKNIYKDSGVAPGAHIYVTRRGKGDNFQKMFPLAQDSAARIVNISMGAVQKHYDIAINEKTNKLYKALARSGKLIIKSAGNEGRNTRNSEYLDSLFRLAHDINSDQTNPGYMIIVMNAKREWNKAILQTYSNRPHESCVNAHYSLCAIGENIHSTVPRGQFGEKTGTSMSTPYVSGASALLMQAFPNLSTKIIGMALLDGALPVINMSNGRIVVNRIFGRGYLHAMRTFCLLNNYIRNCIQIKRYNQRVLNEITLFYHKEMEESQITEIYNKIHICLNKINDPKLQWYNDLFNKMERKSSLPWENFYSHLQHQRDKKAILRTLFNISQKGEDVLYFMRELGGYVTEDNSLRTLQLMHLFGIIYPMYRGGSNGMDQF